MAFLEQRIDERITSGATGGPSAPGRELVELTNGRLVQNFITSSPLHAYDISHGIRNLEQAQIILNLFYVVMFTPYEGFRFKDRRDYIATQANSSLTFITGSTWQLNRRYAFGPAAVLRAITKVAGTPVVYRTRASVVTVASATVDANTGIATISGHVGGDTYTWEGQFDVPVTFADNEWTAELVAAVNAPWVNLPSIRLREVRL